ncbi:hypothetical protein PS928_05499 [Pseudomonas fluorescens]|jgi:hypothetical protein|uniref:Uncharacterized protein n=1 Tax=Pseudomonas fluorescens TaxID=294 RepID=A0A5E7VKH1_PSEFL|nr:hypothetical protein PS928_05499 [Pseudomonas fluorescens]
MGSKRSEINTFDYLPQMIGVSKGFLITEANFFASLTN